MPLANIYDPLLALSVALQLRIGKCLALQIESQTMDADYCAKQLLQIDGMLQDSLQIYENLAMEIPSLEAEILFVKGKKQLFKIPVQLNVT